MNGHQVLIPHDSEYPRWRCPFPADSTLCGLVDENPQHDYDRCQWDDEGSDGCDGGPGWKKTTGCAVAEVAGSNGLTPSDLGIEAVPLHQWVDVDVEWDGAYEDCELTVRVAG